MEIGSYLLEIDNNVRGMARFLAYPLQHAFFQRDLVYLEII